MSRTVQVYNLSRVMRSQSDYAKKINFLSASIFGELKRTPDAQTKSLVKVQWGSENRTSEYQTNDLPVIKDYTI